MDRGFERRIARAASIALALALGAGSALAGQGAGAPAAAGSPAVLDETVATVNGDLITRSDVLWNLAVDPSVRPEDFWTERSRELMLRTLVDQRLLLEEIGKLPLEPVTDQEVAKARADLAARFNTPDDPTRFERRTKLVGLVEARLDEILRNRLLIEKYVDFRFRSFVVVTEPEVVRYYETEIKPKLQERGVVLTDKDFADARPQIERALTEEKISSSVDAYLEEARTRAEIVRLDK